MEALHTLGIVIDLSRFILEGTHQQGKDEKGKTVEDDSLEVTK